ncbi:MULTISPECIES: translation initiation factor IF-2 N-terminal domain-containing protein [unclassified Rhodococcus (in: high G+C Gram-positive bacteria)]|uniref:translation initiation factor IF-2 N-terminal domain-containing protein n=1 Tax=Rhodococcus sp. SJ-3 TaxID=3454628 RepID=UPI003F7A7055
MADQEPQENNSTEANALNLPAKIRVHALAKLLGLTSKQVMAKAAELGTELRSAHSTLPREAAEELHSALSGPAEQVPPTQAPSEVSVPAEVPVPAEVSEAVETPVQAEATEIAEAPVADESTTGHTLELDDTKDAAATQPVAAPSVGGPTGLFTSLEQDTPLFEMPEPVPAGSTEQVAAPLFLQPEVPSTEEGENRPRRRRARRGTAAAVADEATASTETTAEAAPETEATAESTESVPAEGHDEQDDHPRRRRRGRRGRGRGRGDSAEHEQQDGSSEQSEREHSEQAKSGDSESDSSEEKAAPAVEPAADETAVAGAEDSRPEESEDDSGDDDSGDEAQGDGTSRRRRRRRRRRGTGDGAETASEDDPPNTVVHEREPRTKARAAKDEVQGISGSTRLEAKRQRRRDGREAGRRRPPILTESEFLARRESVERVMVVREKVDGPHIGMTQVAVLEDGILVEHFVTSAGSASMVGNIYIGRVQNVLPSMEAAFIDIGRGRNGVLYAGEVNWEAAGLGGQSRKIEQALKPGDQVVVQVSKDPVGHKGARLTTQISLAGRFLVYVPGGSSTGISRKLPDTERKRLKDILREIVPADAGVIIRTAAEGVSEDELARDVARLQSQWEAVREQADKVQSDGSGQPKALYEEPDLLVKVVRDLFNEDFSKLVIEGEKSWNTVESYIRTVASDLLPRVERYRSESTVDVFGAHRIDEQLAKALDRKVWLPSGGTLVIDRTEAMTVVDVNTGKFTGAGGNLEETVTRNNLEAAEEIVRQMRLRDIGGMIVVDFIDMVLESNRDLVLRRLTEALGRDRTRHQVSEVTSLGLVQMTRKRLGTGLVEAFSTTCDHCQGRGIIVHSEPVEAKPAEEPGRSSQGGGSRRKRGRDKSSQQQDVVAEPAAASPAHVPDPEEAAKRAAHPVALAMAAHQAHDKPADDAAPAAASTPQVDTAAGEVLADAVVAENRDAETVETKEDASEVHGEAVSDLTEEREVPAKPVEPERGEQSEPVTTEPVTTEPETTEQEEVAEPGIGQSASTPRRRRARRVSRPAAAPVEDRAGEPRVFVMSVPTSETTAEPAEPEHVAPTNDGAADVEIVRRPRRRRAAGRPAGPPVDAQV